MWYVLVKYLEGRPEVTIHPGRVPESPFRLQEDAILAADRENRAHTFGESHTGRYFVCHKKELHLFGLKPKPRRR